MVCGYGGGFGVRGQAVTAITLRLCALVYFLKVIYAEVARHFNGTESGSTRLRAMIAVKNSHLHRT